MEKEIGREFGFDMSSESPKPLPRSRNPSSATNRRQPELNGSSAELLGNAERLLAKLNKTPSYEYREQKQQLGALIKLLRDPLFQEVYKANLEVEEKLAKGKLWPFSQTSRFLNYFL